MYGGRSAEQVGENDGCENRDRFVPASDGGNCSTFGEELLLCHSVSSLSYSHWLSVTFAMLTES